MSAINALKKLGLVFVGFMVISNATYAELLEEQEVRDRFPTFESTFQVPDDIRQMDKDAKINDQDSAKVKAAKADLKTSLDNYYEHLKALHRKYDKPMQIQKEIAEAQTAKNYLRLTMYESESLVYPMPGDRVQFVDQFYLDGDLGLIEIDRHILDMVTPGVRLEDEYKSNAIRKMEIKAGIVDQPAGQTTGRQ